jgi:hypothetical protein
MGCFLPKLAVTVDVPFRDKWANSAIGERLAALKVGNVKIK